MRGGPQIARFDRHGVNLIGIERRTGQKTLENVREVPVRIAGRRHALIHLNDVHCAPWQLSGGKAAQHNPRCTSAAQSHDEQAAGRDRFPRVIHYEGRGSFGSRFGVGKYFDVHRTSHAARRSAF